MDSLVFHSKSGRTIPTKEFWFGISEKTFQRWKAYRYLKKYYPGTAMTMFPHHVLVWNPTSGCRDRTPHLSSVTHWICLSLFILMIFEPFLPLGRSPCSAATSWLAECIDGLGVRLCICSGMVGETDLVLWPCILVFSKSNLWLSLKWFIHFWWA